MSLALRDKELSKLTINKSLITVDLTTHLQQITNYDEWSRALRKAEALVDNDLQSALSIDTSKQATFTHLFEEMMTDKGESPSRSARLKRVQVELHAAYMRAVDFTHTCTSHAAGDVEKQVMVGIGSSAMILGKPRPTRPKTVYVESVHRFTRSNSVNTPKSQRRTQGGSASQDREDKIQEKLDDREDVVVMPKRVHEISVDEAFDLFNKVEARDEAEIERFRKDVHYLSFTGDLESRDEARLRKVLFEDILASMMALTEQFRMQIPYGNLYEAWRSVERKAIEVNAGAVMERYAASMLQMRLAEDEEVLDYAERYKTFYNAARAHGFRRTPSEWRINLLRALEDSDTPVVEHYVLLETMDPHEDTFEPLVFLQMIVNGCTSATHGPGRRRRKTERIMEEKHTGFVLPVRETDTGGKERGQRGRHTREDNTSYPREDRGGTRPTGRPAREGSTSYSREDRGGTRPTRDRSPYRIEDRPSHSGRGGRIRDRGGRGNGRYGRGQDNYQSKEGSTRGSKGKSMGDGTKDPSRFPCWDWADGKCDRELCGFYHKPRGADVTPTPVFAHGKGNLVLEGDKKAKAMMIVKMLQSQDDDTRDFIRQQAYQDLN